MFHNGFSKFTIFVFLHLPPIYNLSNKPAHLLKEHHSKEQKYKIKIAITTQNTKSGKSVWERCAFRLNG